MFILNLNKFLFKILNQFIIDINYLFLNLKNIQKVLLNNVYYEKYFIVYSSPYNHNPLLIYILNLIIITQSFFLQFNLKYIKYQ